MADLPKPGSSLPVLQTYIRQELGERGFSEETVAQKFMLFMEEVGELARAARRQADIKVADDTKTANLYEEFGDVLILFLDLCNALHVDAEKALIDKERKNKTREWS